MNNVIVHDKEFKIFITRDEIRTRIMEMGIEVSNAFEERDPVFVAILNGSFMFAADMVRACKFDSELIFIKLASYEGTKSTGKMRVDLDFPYSLEGRDVIILEDIIDTGNTIKYIIDKIKEEHKPASVTMVSLLFKPDALGQKVPLDYIGFRIPNLFVVGYGLDYDGLGRTLPDIYQLVE